MRVNNEKGRFVVDSDDFFGSNVTVEDQGTCVWSCAAARVAPDWLVYALYRFDQVPMMRNGTLGSL